MYVIPTLQFAQKKHTQTKHTNTNCIFSYHFVLVFARNFYLRSK